MHHRRTVPRTPESLEVFSNDSAFRPTVGRCGAGDAVISWGSR